MYEFWIETDKFFNIFSLYGRERDKYTESGTAGQIIRKRDCPAESGTVGMYGVELSGTYSKHVMPAFYGVGCSWQIIYHPIVNTPKFMLEYGGRLIPLRSSPT